MHQRLLAQFLLILSPFVTPVVLSSARQDPRLRGVAPGRLTQYHPSTSGTWKCLDGSKEISWEKVNDDFCDCPDGSDEPGTSACPNSTFHCKNLGHIGADIPSTRVGDGLCEKDCCDGSDEAEGVCKNICEEVGAVHRERQEAEARVRKTGSKIRSSYVTFAQKEKKRLEDSITHLTGEVETKRREEITAKNTLDHAESLSQAALEHKKKSPLYSSLVSHREALESLLEQHKALQAREKALSDVLRNLKEGYNPNYQDMAVLEAVRGWDSLSGEKTKDEGESSAEPALEEEVEEEEEEQTKWDEKEIKKLTKTDLISLLLQHDSHLSEGETGNSEVFDIESYLPDALFPAYDRARSSVVGLLTTLGIVHSASQPSEETNKARDAHTKAVNALRTTERKLEDEKTALSKLFDPEWFGSEGEWKKLENLCLQKDTGEYIYEVCLFGAAAQKGTRGGGHHSLGRFSSWNKDAAVGTPNYYTKQHYTRGARCWNGPERSVTVVFVCGLENALLAVTEPEKCEYRLTGTTPALCRPPEEDGVGIEPPLERADGKAKEEL